MKIAILSNKYPPKWLGGTEIASFYISNNLSKLGNHVYVITSKDNDFFYDTKKNLDITYIQMPKTRIIQLIVFWLKIVFEIRKKQPDIIIVQSIGLGLPAFIAKIFFKIPYMIWCQGSDVYYQRGIIKFLNKVYLKNAEKTLVLTHHMREFILSYLNIEIEILPNGVNTNMFNKLIDKKLPGDYRPNNLLFIGSLRKIKGVNYLIDSLKMECLRKYDLVLTIIGEGPEKELLTVQAEKEILSRKINFIGQIPNCQIPKYLFECDIFLLPSLSEGFPLVLLEAMAAGKPIIASDVRGLKEIVVNGTNGFLVPPKNPEEIAQKIAYLLDNKNLRKKIGENNIIQSKEYDWEKIAQRLQALINESLYKVM